MAEKKVAVAGRRWKRSLAISADTRFRRVLRAVAERVYHAFVEPEIPW